MGRKLSPCVDKPKAGMGNIPTIHAVKERCRSLVGSMPAAALAAPWHDSLAGLE